MLASGIASNGIEAMLEVGGTLYAIYLPSAPGSAWGLYTINGSGGIVSEIYSPLSGIHFDGLAPDPLTSRPIPVPATILLLAPGLAGLIGFKVARKKLGL